MSLITDIQKDNVQLLAFFHLEYKNAGGADLDLYFHPNGSEEVFNSIENRIDLNNTMMYEGNEYSFVGIDITGIKLSDAGQVNSPKLKVSNQINGQANFMTALCLAYSNLVGAKLTITLTTLNAYNNNTGQHKKQIWWVERMATLNQAYVEFELKSPLDFRKQKIPTRLVSMYCPFAMRGEYRGESCAYTGSNYFNKDGDPVGSIALDVCGGLPSDCIKRFGDGNVINHGGFMINFNQTR